MQRNTGEKLILKRSEKIRIGSRGSELALWQSNWVKEELKKHHPRLEIETVVIKTTGDRILDSPLSNIGNKGLFIKELEHALLDGAIDLAVHSLKDIPTAIPDGLILGAVTRREDVHDVFINHPRKLYKKLQKVPTGAKIATGSLRRKCQLLHWRPDLEIVDIRGNIPTRLKKLDESGWDGLVLARAGLLRLGLEKRISEVLPFERMLPAVGQGALAVEIRAEDAAMRNIVLSIHDESTSDATASERALLRHLEGGCQIPIGAYGRLENDVLILDAMIGSVDGRKTVRGKIHGSPGEAEHLGRLLAQTLLEGGGGEILESIRGIPQIEVPLV